MGRGFCGFGIQGGRGHRPFRAQRSRKDDDFLHDRRPHQTGRRTGLSRGRRNHPSPHVSESPKGGHLPSPGTIGFPQTHGRRKPSGHSGDVGSFSGRKGTALDRASGRTETLGVGQKESFFPFGRRKEKSRDYSFSGYLAPIYSLR